MRRIREKESCFHFKALVSYHAFGKKRTCFKNIFRLETEKKLRISEGLLDVLIKNRVVVKRLITNDMLS